MHYKNKDDATCVYGFCLFYTPVCDYTYHTLVLLSTCAYILSTGINHALNNEVHLFVIGISQRISGCAYRTSSKNRK